MTQKTKNILLWILTAMVGFIFIASASAKLLANTDALAAVSTMGLSATSYKVLGLIEILSVVLFIIPRTGLLGTLLLVAYLGGAIATHLEHNQSIVAPIAIACFVWIVATVRFAELTKRIRGLDN